MGTFAETAIVDYRLSFADQGKQTSFFRFLFSNGSLPIPFFFCNKQTEVAIFVSSVFRLRNSGNTDNGDMESSNGKRKTEDHAIFLNPSTVCSSCKRKFVVCPFVDEETN
jgi:hypothetical protein